MSINALDNTSPPPPNRGNGKKPSHTQNNNNNRLDLINIILYVLGILGLILEAGCLGIRAAMHNNFSIIPSTNSSNSTNANSILTCSSHNALSENNTLICNSSSVSNNLDPATILCPLSGVYGIIMGIGMIVLGTALISLRTLRRTFSRRPHLTIVLQ